jgi:DNA repair exonuclease SbcCD ATPase subunit
MLNSVHLENFRKHADRTVTFGPGINAIRAANENGKTTILTAIAYALFGTTALDESLDDVVTYGVPVGKLKVTVAFDMYDVDYIVTRGKAGAELLANGQVQVTGQREVTKAIEALFGANADMAGKLMIASQSSLRGALADGPKAAGELIEYLADFDLIDRVINLVQSKLVNGATTSVESRIALLTTQAEEKALIGLAPLEAEVAKAEAGAATAHVALTKLLEQSEALDVNAANTVLADQKRLQASIDRRTVELAALDAKLAVALPVAPADEEVAALRIKVEQQKDLASALALKAELVRAPTAVLWDEPLENLHAEIAKALDAVKATEADHAQADAALRNAERAAARFKSDQALEIAQLEGRLIKDESCAFCGKDLKDIPEVALNNNPLYAKIQVARAAVAPTTEKEQAWLTKAQLADSKSRTYLLDLRDVDQANAKVSQLYARAERFIKLDTSTVPAQWTWIGPTGAPQDFAGDLAKLEAQGRAAVAGAAARREQTGQRIQLAGLMTHDELELEDLKTVEAQATLDTAAALKPLLVEAQTLLKAANAAVEEAQGDLNIARTENHYALKGQAEAKVQLAAAQAEMLEMQANNVLIKKVRGARATITDKLWNITLAAVSRYAGQVRGEVSTITRGEGGFRINGNPVAGLSGSAKDVLGLAIRIALTKTFIPATPFMILDEAAAACDDQREIAMLGLLATLDFDQVILVTHSDLVDAYAQNVITL